MPGRSNWIRVTSEEALVWLCDTYGLSAYIDDHNGVRRYSFFFQGGIPDFPLDDPGGEELLSALSKLLVENEVAVVYELGATTLGRSYFGVGWAVDSSGRRINVSLDDVIRRAEEEFEAKDLTHPDDPPRQVQLLVE